MLKQTVHENGAATKGILRRSLVFRPVLSTVLLITISSAIGAAQPQAVAQQDQKSRLTTVVIGQECLQCHRDLTQAYAVSPHGKVAQFLKGADAITCDTCHGDPTRHNVNGNPGRISSPYKLPTAEANALCLKCHSRDESHAGWLGSPHDRNDMSCVSCHREHHVGSDRLLTRTGGPPTPLMLTQVSEKLLKQTEQELCLSCHKDKRKATLQRSTHLFSTEHGDTKVTCTSCHNPHGGEGRRMLADSSITQLCLQCHAEKRGPFLWEHPPVRENCNTCHVSHGSNNPHLLKARSTVLCQSCHMHMMWRHQTVAGFDIFTFNQGCNNCHANIHGSNHPSGKAFTR
jgi:predicted CXXCH cytochrome family protein